MRRRALDAGLIALAGALAYANTLRVPFTLDDESQLLASEVVRDLALAVRELPLAPRAFGRLTFALDHAIHGFDVTGFHLVNLAIHLSAAVVVWALARVLWRAADTNPDEGTARAAPFAAGLLFALHPLQTQAVTYVVQRYASLAALLYLAALLAYGRFLETTAARARGALYFGSLLLAFLSMRTKEIAFTLPFAVVLLDLAFARATALARTRRLLPHLALVPLIPLVALWAGRGVATAGGSEGLAAATDAGSALSGWSYLLNQLPVMVSYLRLIALPIGQSIDHDPPLHRSLDLEILACALLLSALLAGGAWLLARGRRARRPQMMVAGFGIVFFFLAASVESSFLPIADLMVEHRLYLPMAGVAMATGALARLLLEATGRTGWGRRGVAAALAALALALGVATFLRNEVWRSNVTLWTDAMEKAPGKLRPVLNVRVALRVAGEREASIRLANRAVALEPQDSEDLYGLGLAWRDLGNLDAAEAVWRRAVDVAHRPALPMTALGTLAYDRGDVEGAIAWLRRALESDPTSPSGHIKLAILLDRSGRHEAAVPHFQAFVRMAPPNLASDVAEVRRMLQAEGRDALP